MSSRGGESSDSGPLIAGVSNVQTHVFRGRSVDEVIPMIQRELGSDAIVVRRREGLSGGVLGFFQHPYVEIEAIAGAPRVDIYDEDLGPSPLDLLGPPAEQSPPLYAPAEMAPPPAAAAASAAPPQASPLFDAGPFFRREPEQAPSQGSYLTGHLAELAREPPRAPAPERPPPRPVVEPVDFDELLARSAPRARRTQAPAARPRRRAPVTAERRTVPPGANSRARAGVERTLRAGGISEALTAELIDGAMAHALPLAPRSGLASAVRTTLAQRIPVAPQLPVKGAAIVVVGAGGAGKTSCCAALLGAYRSAGTLPASCATLTRDASSGELQMILSPHVTRPLPARGSRAVRALTKARRDGLALVDTPALSPSDRTHIRELSSWLADTEPDRVLVALPATMGAAAAAQLLSALHPLAAHAIAVTHADETDQLGVAVEAACTFGLAPEYMLERGRTGGWRVSRVDPSTLAARLLP